MKFTKAACLVVAAVLTLSTASQAAAAGIQIDGNGRQTPATNTTAYGIAIDPDGRAYGIAIDPNGRAGGSILDPDGRSWLSSLLHRWFGWA